MNIIDIIILICFIPAIINGIRKGFIAQVISVVSLILGVWLSYKFATVVGSWLSTWLQASSQLLNVIAFIVIFAIVILVLYLIGKVLEKTIKIIMLGWLNRLLGVLFALLKCILIVGLLIVVFDSINGIFKMVNEDYISDSALYGPIKSAFNSVFPYIKNLISSI